MQIDRTTTYMRCTVGLLIILATAVLVLAPPAAAGAKQSVRGTAESCTEEALSRAIARAGAGEGRQSGSTAAVLRPRYS